MGRFRPKRACLHGSCGVRRWDVVTDGPTEIPAADPHPPTADLARRTAAELARSLADGSASSAGVVAALLERIAAVDHSGPMLRSVICVNPQALREAEECDAALARGEHRGPLHGIPVLIKDNVDTAGPMGNTAGSYALQGWAPAEDAPLVAQLRRAGAVILGKANLSEWANFRGRPSSSG